MWYLTMVGQIKGNAASIHKDTQQQIRRSGCWFHEFPKFNKCPTPTPLSEIFFFFKLINKLFPIYIILEAERKLAKIKTDI